jgi:hypothetical protein
VPHHQPPEQDLEGNRKDKPEHANSKQFPRGRCANPSDTHEGDGKNDHRAGEDGHLSRSETSEVRLEKHHARDPVHEFGGHDQ